MSPIITITVTALERVAQLIEKGMPTAKAMKQVVHELEDYEAKASGRAIPTRAFTSELGLKQ